MYPLAEGRCYCKTNSPTTTPGLAVFLRRLLQHLDSTHFIAICPRSDPYTYSLLRLVQIHPFFHSLSISLWAAESQLASEQMMPVNLSYGEDASVAMGESASLVPDNMAVLPGVEEGSVAYGLVSRHVAALTYVASAASSASKSESIGFPGPQEDASFRTLTGVRTSTPTWCAFIRNVPVLQMEWCRLKSSRVVLVLTSYRGFRVTLYVKHSLCFKLPHRSRAGMGQRQCMNISLILRGDLLVRIMIFFLQLTEDIHSLAEQRFAKGVTSVDNTVCVGELIHSYCRPAYP